jgi:hypothetical protein
MLYYMNGLNPTNLAIFGIILWSTFYLALSSSKSHVFVLKLSRHVDSTLPLSFSNTTEILLLFCAPVQAVSKKIVVVYSVIFFFSCASFFFFLKNPAQICTYNTFLNQFNKLGLFQFLYYYFILTRVGLSVFCGILSFPCFSFISKGLAAFDFAPIEPENFGTFTWFI